MLNSLTFIFIFFAFMVFCVVVLIDLFRGKIWARIVATLIVVCTVLVVGSVALGLYELSQTSW